MTRARFRVVSKRQSVNCQNAQKWEIELEPIREGAKAWAEDCVRFVTDAQFAASLEVGRVYALKFEAEP